MRKIVTNTIAVIVAGMLLPGCSFKTGSGEIVSETRTTGPFHAVNVGGDFHVDIKKGDREQVIVEADDNLIGNIETKVVDGTLRIRSTDNSLRNPNFTVTITAPQIDDISASASATINVKDVLSSPRAIKLKASSASEINAEVNSPVVTAESSSAGELNLSGRTRNFKASTSSGSSIKAMALLAETSTVSSSSGASAWVYASVSLDASASSGSDIRYRGNANVKKSVRSGAEISKDN